MNIEDTSGPKMPRVDVDWQGGRGGSALDVECKRCGSVGGFGCYECTPAPRPSVQEAAKVLLTEYLDHGEGLLGELACHDISWDETGAEMLPDIDGEWVRFTDVEAALRALAQKDGE